MMRKKGMTLVEVLVASLVFSLTFGAVCTTYLLSRKGEAKQRAYLHFETMCLEFNEFSDIYKRNWRSNYFNDDPNLNQEDSFTKYYDLNYQIVDDLNQASYIMDIRYENVVDSAIDISKYPSAKIEHLEMVVNVKTNDNHKIIKELVYGSRGGRYEKE